MPKHYKLTEVIEQRLLPWSERTIRRMIAAGEIKPLDVGRGNLARYVLTDTEIARVMRKVRTTTPERQSMRREDIETK